MSGGAQSGSQNQNQTTNSSFNQNGTSNSQSTANPTATWLGLNQNAAGALSGSGLTPDQNYAVQQLEGRNANQAQGWNLQGANTQAQGVINSDNNGGIPQVGTSQVGAPTAGSQMGQYENSYANDVLNPSLASFDNATAMQNNATRASRDSGSAFGSRAGVADDVLSGQQALARGQLAAGITGTGYQTAIGAGQSDAANALSASNANAGYGLAASQANSGNKLASNNQVLSSLGLMSGNDVNTNNLGLQNTEALYNMSGGGLSNIINLMGANVPAFGQTNSGTTTNSGTGVSNTVGSGSSSSKGGGFG